METKDFVLGYGAGKSAVSEKIVEEVDAWLDEHITNPDSPPLDRSLTSSSAAAPADMVGDINDEVGDLRNTLNHKADMIYDTASGDIASFPDGADGLPVKDLTVAIEPVQSGTGDPSPTNVRSISGWTGANVTRTGKNLLEQTVREYRSESLDANINADSVFIIRADATNQGLRLKLCSGNMNVLPAGTYTLSSDSNDVYVTITSSGTTAKTMTVVSDGTFVFDNIRMFVRPNTALSNVTVHFTLMRVSDIFAVTVPFHDSQGDPLTIYGGTLDVTSGVLTVTDANIASYNGETLPGEWISDRDVYAAGTTPTTGAQVVYKLATPQPYPLTPEEVTTLLGQNNIWADCGPSTVEYPCDTKLYIQKINTPTDDDMIADAQIASGKYFIVNNNLYLSTAAILAGDPIKPGTNCTLTNLAEALNALNS